eukprot:TRINITY_DN65081_c0_g1_i1.p1 TRINITY_DN65081_c0_g1~~TRINITY_DN65081_c0_g1_i1.p1  ORF type:complete len:385 (+),score=40.52 TRINITY_DN65081_c0_g1_i1:46-1155(+)
MGRFEDTLGLVINLIKLSENVYTTFFFDEDKFGAIMIALVFCFEPILESIVKQLLTCTECDWVNFIYDLSSEGTQCFLFIYFCNFSEDAKIVLPAMMGSQVLLMIVLQVKKRCVDAPDEEQTTVGRFMDCVTCCSANCISLVTGLMPLFFLLCQEEAPYRQKPFEVLLASSYWLNDIILQSYFHHMQEATKGFSRKDFEKLSKNFSKMQREAMKEAMRKSWVVRICIFGQLAFFIYCSVLAWIYWFSGDIREVFDKVYTMIQMVSSCLIGCLPLCCSPCLVIRFCLWEEWQQLAEQEQEQRARELGISVDEVRRRAGLPPMEKQKQEGAPDISPDTIGKPAQTLDQATKREETAEEHSPELGDERVFGI